MEYTPDPIWFKETEALDAGELAIVARSMIVARKAVNTTLPADILHDPSLDMLLHLFVEYVSNHVVIDKELCSMTTVPPHTAMRWLGHLDRLGLVTRADASVEFTPSGMDQMTEMLRAVVRSQADI